MAESLGDTFRVVAALHPSSFPFLLSPVFPAFLDLFFLNFLFLFIFPLLIYSWHQGFGQGQEAYKPAESTVLCGLSHFSRVQLFVTLGTVARQTPLSMGFSRQEYGSGLHALLQGIFPTQESNSCLSCLLHQQVGSLPLVPPGKQKALVQPLRKAHLRRKDKIGVEPTNTE